MTKLDIKALRQEETDLNRERDTLKTEARTILAGEYGDKERTRMGAIDMRADEIDTRMVALSADIRTWERHRDEELHAPAMRRGGEDEEPPPPAEAKHSPKLFATFGEQLQAVARAGRSGGAVDPRLMELQKFGAVSGMSEGVSSDGGFLVQTDIAAEVMRETIQESQVWPKARLVPLSGNSNGIKINTIEETSRADGSRWGGIRAYWVGEGSAPTASRPKFGRVELELKKLAAICYTTDEMLQDAAALDAILREGFSEEFSFKLDDAAINGDGQAKPQGILNAACLVTQDKETGQAADTVQAENLSKMWARFPVRSRANAVWFVNQNIEPQLDALSIAAGLGALEPRFVTYGPDGILRIKARPVIAIEQAASIGDVGDIILADMRQYARIERGPMQAATSMHVKFIEDEMTFRFTIRVDGQSVWKSAVTPYKGGASYSVSPFVVLQAR